MTFGGIQVEEFPEKGDFQEKKIKGECREEFRGTSSERGMQGDCRKGE